MSPLFGFSLGPPELIVISLLSLLFFGNRLPGMMRSLGLGVTEFKKGIQGVEEEINRPVEPGQAASETQPTANSTPTSQ